MVNKMIIEKLITGAWRVSDIINGYRVERVYYGYTKKQAVKQFNLDCEK